MVKAIYNGKEPYKTKEFHASPGNIVFMSDSQWRSLGTNQALFKKLQTLKKAFPTQITRLPGWSG
jgi:hypothetical protein